jgi:hypothetical protein
MINSRSLENFGATATSIDQSNLYFGEFFLSSKQSASS